MPEIEPNLIWLQLGIVAAIVIAWSAMFFALRGHKDVLREMFSGSTFLRMVTVALIVLTAGMVSLSGAMSAELAAILSGIAGYVLGGARDDKPKPHEPEGQ